MSGIAEIGKALQQLSAAELARFRKWYAEFDSLQWDRQLEADAPRGNEDGDDEHYGRRQHAADHRDHVLRAILWRKSGNITHATRMAGICGILIAGMIILFGVYIMIAPNWRPSRPYFMGVWSILVGLFLLDTATKVVRSAQSAKLVTVGDVMSPPVTIAPELPVSTLIDEVLPLHRQTSFPVALNKQLQGILALEDLKSLPRERWRTTHARDVMRPIGPRFFVEPSTTLDRARELMKRNGVGSLAVINSNGELVGFLLGGKLRRRERSPA